MADIESLLFYFIRKGLWKTDEAYTGPAIPREKWIRLFELAREQAVTGLLIDGISRTTMRPDSDIWDKWIAHLLHIEQTNKAISKYGLQWQESLKENGISSKIFKGSSVAAWYPEPLHRSYGDIDMVITSGYDRMEKLLRSKGIPYKQDSDGLTISDGKWLSIEFHPRMEYVYNPFANKRLQRLCGDPEYSDSNELYFACLIMHLQRHFLSYGIGLKAVCDLAAMLYFAELDRQKAARILKHIGIGYFSRLLFGFIDLHIGVATDYPLLPIRSGRNFGLLRDVILGNGYRLKTDRMEATSRIRPAFFRILSNSLFWTRRELRLYPVSPSETLCFLGHMAKRRVKTIFNRNKNI